MTGNIDPTSAQFKKMMELEDDGPIWMLNMIRFREKAAYEDGREATGAEAYLTYSKESAKFFQGVGGKIAMSGGPKLVLIGPEDEHWDAIFVAEYPNAAAFGKMVKDPGYQAIVYHRQAAVEDSRLIRIKPSDSNKLFG